MDYTLTTSEEHIMQTCWQFGEFYFKDLLENLPHPQPHHNTLSTFLKILTAKKFLAGEKQGRILKYKVLITKDEFRREKLKNFVKNYFENAAELIAVLQEEKYLTVSDVKTAEPDDISVFVSEILSPKKEKKSKKKKKKKE